MLTLATVGDFRRRKRIGDTDWNLADVQERRWVMDELRAATRYIHRIAHRQFFPRYDTRNYAIPYHFADLSLKRKTASDIYLDDDLLEMVELTNEAGTALTANTDYFLQDLNIYPKYAVSIKFPNYWTGNGISVTTLRHIDQIAVTAEGIWGYHDDYANAWVDTLEDVPAGMTSSSTTIAITDAEDADADGLAPRIEIGYLLKIEDEYLEVTDVPDKNSITVLRGVRGSVAAAHAEGEDILRWSVVEDIAQACYQIAKTWREANAAVGGRQGVSEMSTGVEIKIPSDPLSIVKSYRRYTRSNQK